MSEAPEFGFVPTPSPLTQSFWDSAAAEVLVRQRCRGCGSNMFPPQFACRTCLSVELEWTASTGFGTLYSFSVLHMSDAGLPLPVPTVLADVNLEEGWHMMTNIVGCSFEDVTIGMPLEVSWRRLSPTINLPVFIPAISPATSAHAPRA